MADEIKTLGVKIEVDSSSVQRARVQYENDIKGMANSTRQSFEDIKARTDLLINKANEMAAKRRQSIYQIEELDMRQARSAQSAALGVQSAFNQIVGAIGVVTAAVFTAVKAFDELRKAAEFREMVQSSSNLARAYGVDMASIMQAMDKASNGTLTMQAKIKLFNEAVLAGGGDLAYKLPKLVEIAHAAATATGSDFDTVINKLMTGIERGSARMINSARIYLDVKDAVQEYADALGMSVDEIDDQTKVQLTANAVIAASGPLMKAVSTEAQDSADLFGQLAVSADTFIKVMGQIATVSTLVEGLKWEFDLATEAVIKLGAASVGAITMTQKLLESNAGAIEAFFKGGPVVGPLLATQKLIENRQSLTEAVRAGQLAEEEVYKRTAIAKGIVPPVASKEELEATRLRLAEEQKARAAREKQLKDEQTYREKMRDLIVKSGEQVLQEQQKYWQQIEDAEIDHYRKLDDIAINGARKREDLSIELERNLEDIDIEEQQTIEENAQEHASKLIDIEERYQDKLRDVQRKFEDEAFEAVKNRDALALVTAMRNRQRGIEDATYSRDRDMSKEERDNAERNENAKESLERKRADARRHYQQALEDQRRAEQRAQDDETRSYQQRQDDMARHHQWQMDELRRHFAEELAAMNGAFANEEAAAQAHVAAMAAILSSIGLSVPATPSPTAPAGGGGSGWQYMAEGGTILASTPTHAVFGEAGPELAMFMPLGGASRTLPAPASVNVGGMVSHKIDAVITRGMRNAEGRIVATLRKELVNAVSRYGG